MELDSRITFLEFQINCKNSNFRKYYIYIRISLQNLYKNSLQTTMVQQNVIKITVKLSRSMKQIISTDSDSSLHTFENFELFLSIQK